jgi:hypothetical protein
LSFGPGRKVDSYPPEWRTPIVNYRMHKGNIEKLKEAKRKLGMPSLEATIMHLYQIAMREGLIPPASYSLVFNKYGNKPVILTGESGSGKTTTAKMLVKQFMEQRSVDGRELNRGVFILDVSNEYGDLGLRKIDLGGFFSYEWEKGRAIRFVPSSNVEISKAMGKTIFGHLNFIKNSGELKNWCIVIEEAHRFGDDPNLRALLIEARKFIRKLIIITTDWKAYEGIAPIVHPMRW